MEPARLILANFGDRIHVHERRAVDLPGTRKAGDAEAFARTRSDPHHALGAAARASVVKAFERAA